jgi:hypothetical protein
MQTLIAFNARGTDGSDPTHMNALYEYYGYRVSIPATTPEVELEGALYNALSAQQRAFVDERKSQAAKLAHPATIAAEAEALAAAAQLDAAIRDLQPDTFAALSAAQRTETLRLGVLTALRVVKWLLLRIR